MKYFLIIGSILMSGCSTVWDPHAPSTIVAPATGGDVKVEHGQRLQVNLPAAAEGSEWRPRQPMTLVVLVEGVPARDGVRMTPVRSGTDTLRFDEMPLLGEGSAQRSVTYQVTVP